jgi:hypothetical protein
MKAPPLAVLWAEPSGASSSLKAGLGIGCDRWRVQPVFNQVIAIPFVLIAGEAEEMIDDATAGGGDLELVGVGRRPQENGF